MLLAKLRTGLCNQCSLRTSISRSLVSRRLLSTSHDYFSIASKRFRSNVITGKTSARQLQRKQLPNKGRHTIPDHNVGPVKPFRSLRSNKIKLQFKSRHHNRIDDTQEEFLALIHKRLLRMRRRLSRPMFVDAVGLTKETAEAEFENFFMKVGPSLGQVGRESSSMFSRVYVTIREAYNKDGVSGIDMELRFLLQGHVANLKLQQTDFINHSKLADLRYPYEWYSEARALQREIHLHIGPTNSGKTYHALRRLEKASSGVYASPLRLLAHEVYRRLNASGRPCNLITGDERVINEGADVTMSSCTVEMVPMGTDLEVAVIDEIQMIGHAERGWAWTQALLGLRAKEIHLCGEERVLPLIRDLATAVGDTLHVHEYQRLSPLKAMSSSLNGRLKNLRKGDCVVIFSRKGIHAMKDAIEKATNKKVAVVYGSLPPETRAQQARLFNDPDNDYDILVASDAVGMGLNLSIKRIVFESTVKYLNRKLVPLPPSDIKQIAGRAGRFRVATDSPLVDLNSPGVPNKRPALVASNEAPSNLGLVTSLHPIDLPIVKSAMATDAAPIVSAGILPPDRIVIRFASYFPPRTPLSYILIRLHEISKMRSRFHLCQIKDAISIADAIHEVKGLSISDRMIFCASPATLRDPGLEEVLKVYARAVEGHSGGALLDLKVLNLDLLDQDGPGYQHLYDLETLHKSIILYLWLSYRFSGVFVSQALAFHVKSLLEDKINRALSGVVFDEKEMEKTKKLRERAILRSFQEQLEDVELRNSNSHPGVGTWCSTATGQLRSIESSA